MTEFEALMLTICEKVYHQQYFYYLLAEQGEYPTCPLCKRKYIEDAKIWSESEDFPNVKEGQ